MQQIEIPLIMTIIKKFYFNKILTLNNIKIQNDVLTKEMVKAKGLKQLSNFGGIIG